MRRVRRYPRLFRQDAAAKAVDCIQVDVTRCGGYTAWLRAAAVAEAHNLEVSGHVRPTCTRMWLPGAQPAANVPDLEYAGHGLTIRKGDPDEFRVQWPCDAFRPIKERRDGSYNSRERLIAWG